MGGQTEIVLHTQYITLNKCKERERERERERENYPLPELWIQLNRNMGDQKEREFTQNIQVSEVVDFGNINLNNNNSKTIFGIFASDDKFYHLSTI